MSCAGAGRLSRSSIWGRKRSLLWHRSLRPSETLSSKLEIPTRIHWNVDQNVIAVTEDKVRLCLIKHRDALEAKRGWIAPLGTFVTLAATLLTATFHGNFLFSSAVWQAMFVMGTVASALCLLIGSIRAVRARKIGPDSILKDLKQASNPIVSSSPLQILSARYGTADTHIDVTDKLTGMIKDGELNVAVLNENLGGDPAPGKRKSLIVSYRFLGQEASTEVKEGNVLKL